MMRSLTTLAIYALPSFAMAQSNHPPVPQPLHFLSQSGHIVGAVIVVAALIAFFRQSDES